jgi:hypothetical protein
VSYSDSSKCPYKYNPAFTFWESVYNGDYYYISLDSKELKVNNRTMENFSDARVSTYVARQLLRASRTQNLVNYVLKSIDGTIPGIRDYIMQNYAFMAEVAKIMTPIKNNVSVFNLLNEEPDKLGSAPKERKLNIGKL